MKALNVKADGIYKKVGIDDIFPVHQLCFLRLNEKIEHKQ